MDATYQCIKETNPFRAKLIFMRLLLTVERSSIWSRRRRERERKKKKL